MSQIHSVNIRPGVNVLSVLPHLNYKAWFALAEFVDNSIQSSIDGRKSLVTADGNDYVLRVDIQLDPLAKQIKITDNAGGIASKDYQRAFRPAEIPPDATGLSEFGMGMKSAACWFASNWSVRSSALGERVERTVYFDINKIVLDSMEELNVVTSPVAENKHYTEISLEDIRRPPKGKTIQKIKDHLASIYRVYIRKGQLELYFDGHKLIYDTPKILFAPNYVTPEETPINWKKGISIDLGEGKSATGFVAIREKGSTLLAGLALFRRNRLILGSVDETYRPEDIFGRSTTYAYQRIFGEIHLKGFHVSHTKDGIKWDGDETKFLKKLQNELLAKEMPILRQAKGYRSTKDVKANRKTATQALQNTATKFSSYPILPINHPINLDKTDDEEHTTKSYEQGTKLLPLPAKDSDSVQFNLEFRGERWIAKIELSYAEQEQEWLAIKHYPSITEPEPRQVVIRIAMLHPFMKQYSNLESEGLSAVLSIAASMGIAEVVALEAAAKTPSVIRKYSGEILKNCLSRPI